MEDRRMELALRAAAAGIHEIMDVHAIAVGRTREHISVTCHCTLPDDLPMHRVHEVITELEDRFKLECPEVYRVTIHPEPVTDNTPIERKVGQDPGDRYRAPSFPRFLRKGWNERCISYEPDQLAELMNTRAISGFFRVASLLLLLVAVALLAAIATMQFAIHGAEVQVPALKGMTSPTP